MRCRDLSSLLQHNEGEAWDLFSVMDTDRIMVSSVRVKKDRTLIIYRFSILLGCPLPGSLIAKTRFLLVLFVCFAVYH